MADEITPNNESIDYKAKFEEMEAKYSTLKTSFDRTSSENADYKRKERERLTDEEKAKVEKAEQEAKYAELEKKLALRDYADELDDVTEKKVQTEIVGLFVEGKIKEALVKFKEFRAKERAEIEKKIKADLLKQNPQPNAQSTGGGYKSKEEIMAIKDIQARQKAIAENLNLFK